MRDKTRLEGEQTARKAILGRYEKGLATDFEAAERATRIAEEAVEVVREMGHEELPDKFVEALAAASPPPEKIRRHQTAVGIGWHLVPCDRGVAEYLPVDALPGTSEPLEESSLSGALALHQRIASVLEPFRQSRRPCANQGEVNLRRMQ